MVVFPAPAGLPIQSTFDSSSTRPPHQAVVAPLRTRAAAVDLLRAVVRHLPAITPGMLRSSAPTGQHHRATESGLLLVERRARRSGTAWRIPPRRLESCSGRPLRQAVAPVR